MNKIYQFLFSTKITATLFVIFATAMGVATFIENDHGTQTAKALIYNSWWFEAIMAFFIFNFIGNIFKYKLYKKQKLIVLMFHLSFILIIIGAAITRYISYEGIMPIKEGQVSNTFYSEASFINITIDDGEVQKTPFFKKILLSSLGKNDFHYKTDFKENKVAVKLVGYTPNATTVFVEDEKGDDYIHFVESGSGSRHDHYIKKGTSQNVHGVNIGFESDENPLINFSLNDGALSIKSTMEGSFYRMMDKFNGKVVKDSLQSMEYLSLYTISSIKFVVPTPPIKGLYNTIQGDKDANNSDQLNFEITANNETKNLTINGGKFIAKSPSLISVGGLNFRIGYGAKIVTLPFSVKLNDFQLENYPGSNSAMSFASEVTVIAPEETFDYRIFMNNILNYKGYKFFQSSYNITPQYEETHLSVNHDFWGTTITYIGYFLLYLGLILILFLKNTRFSFLRNSLKKIKAKKASLIVLLFLGFSTISYSQHNHRLSTSQIDSIIEATTIDKDHAEEFSKLVIQDYGGRMKPINTFASQLLRKVSKHDTYNDLDANQVFLSIVQNPRFWFQVPMLYLERGNTEVREILGVDKDAKYASLVDFFDDKGTYKLGTYQQEAQKKNIKSKFEKDVINIDKRVNLLYSTINGGILKLFPIPNDKTNKWVSEFELNNIGLKGTDSVFVKQILPVYKDVLTSAKQKNDYTEAEEILKGLQNYQKKYGAAVYPSDKKISLELSYNKYDIFKKLFSYYMYIGTLMFLFVIAQIFTNNKVVNFLVKGSIAIIIGLFLLHTLGLATRWFISGHAPWSNAYESMIYVAWATMFFGLVFGKRSSLTIAATAFLTSMILMIAHWNWMDPEIANLQPVLNSYWLMIHVAIIVASYGPFSLSMILGLIVLLLMVLTTSKNKSKLALTIKELTIINEMSMTVGLVLLTIGNFLGGQWANESWGRYWGWDPKETWALISIMVYAFVLHMRLVPGLRGRYTFNLWSVIAFASIIMTYFGVNFYLSGLHSYASGDKIVTPNFVYYSIGFVSILGIAAYFKFKKYYKKQK